MGKGELSQHAEGSMIEFGSAGVTRASAHRSRRKCVFLVPSQGLVPFNSPVCLQVLCRR